GRPKRLDNSRHPLVVEAYRRFQHIFRCTARRRFDGLLLRLWRKPLERGASQYATVTKIAAHDQFLRGVLIEPALAALEQFVNFILADPIVLGVVQNRNQYVKMIEQRAQASNSSELDARIEVARRRRIEASDWIDVGAPT